MTRIEHDFIGDLEVPANATMAFNPFAVKKTSSS